MAIKIGKLTTRNKGKREGMPPIDPAEFQAFYQCLTCKVKTEIEDVMKSRGKPPEKKCVFCEGTARHWVIRKVGGEKKNV